jgi:hypothetical protein
LRYSDRFTSRVWCEACIARRVARRRGPLPREHFREVAAAQEQPSCLIGARVPLARF